ncbi:MAG TPA: NAD-dependent protein deacylase [Feifaniaceae bacterium]|nr:NAD-dependent protein deacylase [Feifaniaceae bacterium]
MEDHLSSQIDELRSVLSRSKRIAFLGGAGTSTESGIPDFRSENGVFEAIRRFGHKPEVLLSHDFFLQKPEVFFEYYREYLLYPNAKPNDAHRALAQLERAGKLGAVITQNIDGLHQKAGSKSVLELHGSVYRNHCMRCKEPFTLHELLAKSGVPKCDCGGIIKPDVVLYGEGLDEKVLQAAITQISRADTLIIGGTSLAVYPAAGLMDYFSGRNLVVLNLGKTTRDTNAALSISAPIGQVLRRAVLENPMYS